MQAGPREEGWIVTAESKALATLLSHDSVSADASDRARIERLSQVERVIDNLLVRIHFIIVLIRWTGLASWEFQFSFPGSLKSTFLVTMHPSSVVPACRVEGVE